MKNTQTRRYVCRFSCGEASAIATKLTLMDHGPEKVLIVNAFIAEEGRADMRGDALRRQRERRPHASIVFPMRGATHTPMAKSTLNRALARVEQLAKIEHFTVHDLRRTAATNLAEQEYDEAWIEKALNHNKKGVAGIYNRAQYAKQRRDMLQAWADWLDGMKLARFDGERAQQR